MIAKSTRFCFLEVGHECVRVVDEANAVNAVLSIADCGFRIKEFPVRFITGKQTGKGTGKIKDFTLAPNTAILL